MPPTSLLTEDASSVPSSPSTLSRKISPQETPPSSEPNTPKTVRFSSGSANPQTQASIELKTGSRPPPEEKKTKKLGALKLRLWYQEKGNILHVYVLEGRDLTNANPYLKLLIAPDPQKKTRKKTSIVKKSLDPVWNEPFEYPLTPSSLNFKCLRIKLMDHEPASRDSFIGVVEVQLASVCRMSDEAVPIWYNVEAPSTHLVTSGVKIFSGKINAGLFSKTKGEAVSSPRAQKPAPEPEETKSLGTLRACVWCDLETDILHVELFECTGLPPVFVQDLGSFRRDPYIELKLLPPQDSHLPLKSKIIRKTLDPAFNEKFEFADQSKSNFKALHFSVMDCDPFGDKPLGEVVVPLVDLARVPENGVRSYPLSAPPQAVMEIRTLKDLLAFEPGFKSFESFLPEDSKDNLLLWREIQEYRLRYCRAEKNNRPGCMSECVEMIARFWGPNAEYDVDVSPSIRGQIDVALQAEKQTADGKRGCGEFAMIFNDAQTSVLQVMTRDHFASYLGSPQYTQFKQLLAAESPEREFGFRVVNAIPEPTKTLGKVKIRYWYQEKSGTLHVYVLEARDVPKNKSGLASPYIKVILVEPDRETGKKTSVAKKTLEPIWNEPFEFSVQVGVVRACVLRVKLVDCDGAIDTSIGAAEISLGNVPQSGDEGAPSWHKIEPETPESVVDKLSSKVKLLRHPTKAPEGEISLNSQSTDSNSSESFVSPEPSGDEKGIRMADLTLSRGYGVIRAGVWHENETLFVEIVSCVGLSSLNMQKGLKRDALVELQLHPAEPGLPIIRTKIIRQTLDPVFGEVFPMPMDRAKCVGRTLALMVKDFDSFGNDRSIGEALIPLSDVPQAKSVKPYPLNAGATTVLELKSLDSLLRLEAGYKSFLSFLATDSMEMQFWREVQEYHHKYEYAQPQARATCMAECCDLYTKYFGVGAECEVEIIRPVRYKVALSLEDEKRNTSETSGCENLCNLFAEAQIAVTAVLSRSAPAYFHSPQYANFKELLEEPTEKIFGFKILNMLPEPTNVVGELKMRVWYQEKKGLLHVHILEARGLYCKNGAGNPFVELVVAPDAQKKSKKRTPVVKKTVTPVWNAPFEYPLEIAALNFKTIQAEVRDERADTFMGMVELALASVPRVGDAPPEWYPLSVQPEVANESVIASISAKVKQLRTKPVEDVSSPVLDQNTVMSAKAMRMLGTGEDDEKLAKKAAARSEFGFVRAAVWHNDEVGKLNVEILECTGLPPRRVRGIGQAKRDPYVELKLMPQDGSTCLKSKVVRRTLDPIFNEEFEFNIDRSKCTLKTLSLAILDYDAFGIRKIIGEVLISLSDVSRTQYGSTKLHTLAAGSTTVVEIKSLGDLLQLEIGYKAFLACLTKEYSNENLVFWREIQEYRHKYQNAPKDQRPTCMSECWEIFTKYVATGAENEINIPSGTRSKIQKAITEEKQTLDTNRGCEGLAALYDDARHDILTLMTRDSFARFLNSPEYAELSAYLADDASERELGFKVNNLIATVYNIPV